MFWSCSLDFFLSLYLLCRFSLLSFFVFLLFFFSWLVSMVLELNCPFRTDMVIVLKNTNKKKRENVFNALTENVNTGNLMLAFDIQEHLFNQPKWQIKVFIFDWKYCMLTHLNHPWEHQIWQDFGHVKIFYIFIIKIR